MKDAARFALAIAAILSATALDAQQRGAGQARHGTESGSLAFRSGQPGQVAPAKSCLEQLDRDGDGFITAPEAAADDAPMNAFDLAGANRDGRIGDREVC